MKFPGNLSYFLKVKQNWAIPAVFNDYILNKNFCFYSSEDVENYYLKLLSDNALLKFDDFGANFEKKNANNIKKVSEIAKKTSTKYEIGIIFQKIIDYFKIKKILELGTSLGIGTMYLAKTNTNTFVTTIDASRSVSEFAKLNFDRKNIQNVTFINKTFDYVFDNNILKHEKFDLFYLDGNHKSEATLKYLDYLTKNLINEKAIIILDDINWSLDMYRAWRTIVKIQKKAFLLNLFRVGILFVGYDFPRGEFIVKTTNNDFLI